MNHFKKFTYYYLFFLILFSIVVVLFNWLVNPYDIYNSVHLKQLSNKPLVTDHLRLAKAMAVEWKKPQYIIMGSSTAETGLNPGHPSWHNTQVYNLGLAGANIYEVMRYLQHAQATKPLKKVVLAVNFFMFNAYLKNRADFEESLLKVDARGISNPVAINSFFSTLLSYDAIEASFVTINNQDKKNAYKSNGQLILDTRTEQINRLKGYKNNFLYTESYNKETFLPLPHKRYEFIDPNKNINTINYLHQIIKICEQNNTELVIIIAPEHIRLQETYKLLGLWEQYEQWQRKLVTLVQNHNVQYPSSPYILWSFNRVNVITTELIPQKNDASSTMRWFWDPFHFKNRLGNLVLSQVLDPYFQSNITNFATTLANNNIDKELKLNKINLTRWENINKDQVKELRLNLSQAKSK